MTYYTKVLLVDDDPNYSSGMQDLAYNDYNIEIIRYEDWEEAYNELENHQSKYAAVILDVMGKISQDRKGEDPGHLMMAIRDILQLNKDIKYYILTGHFKKISETPFIPPDEKIYRKNSDEEELLHNIREKFSNSEKFEVAKKHPSELDFVENYFLDEQIRDFLKIYGGNQESKEVLRKLRILNERAMDILGIEYLNFENFEEFFAEIKSHKPDANIGGRTTLFLNYFRDRSGIKVPAGIYGMVINIYRTSSEAGSHSVSSSSYSYSNNMIESLKLGFLDVVNWLAIVINNK